MNNRCKRGRPLRQYPQINQKSVKRLSKSESLSAYKVVIMGGILILAALLRIWMLNHRLLGINSDDANIGIMAQDILRGHFPIFYYGGYYYGPLDAYLAAPLIRVWGSSDQILRVFPFISSLLFVWVIYRTGQKLYGETTGLFSALFAALPPVFLTVRGLKVDAAYSFVLLIGSLSLNLFLDWMQTHSRKKLAALIGLSMVGVWVFPLMLYYILAMMLTYLVTVMPPKGTHKQIELSPRKRYLLIGACLILLAGIFVWGGQYSSPVALSERAASISGFFKYAIPVLLGYFPPAEDYNNFAQTMSGVPWVWVALGIISGILVTALGLWMGYRRYQQGNRILFILVTSSAMIYALFFILVGVIPETLSFPRYLFPFYSVIPMWVDALIQLTQRKSVLRYGLVFMILIVNFASNIGLPKIQSPAPNLKTWMLNQSTESYIYTDYWTGYWLAYETGGKVIPYILTLDAGPGNNRISAYADRVSAAADTMVILPDGSSGVAKVRQYLLKNQIQFQVENMDDRIVFWKLSKPIHVTDWQ